MVQLTDRRGLAPGDPAMINARIERLPGIPLAFAARAMLALLYFFAFYDITVIGVALPTVATQFHLGTSGLNLPVTLNLVGYVVGAYVFSIAADKLGRRGALAITLSVLALGALLTAFSWDLVSLSIFRLIVGLGTGSLIAIGATYASELVPAARRGRLTQFNMVMAGIGLGAAPWIARPLMDNSTDGWRILLGLGTLAFVSIGLLRWFPESPRWLAAKGRTSEADAVMSSLEARFGDTLVPVDVASVETGQPALAKSKLPILDLLRPPYLNRMLVVVGFWLAWYFASYAVLGYEPTLLGREGLSEPNSQLFTAIGGQRVPDRGDPHLLLHRQGRPPLRGGGDHRAVHPGAGVLRDRRLQHADHHRRDPVRPDHRAGCGRGLHLHLGDLPHQRPRFGDGDGGRLRAHRWGVRADHRARRAGQLGRPRDVLAAGGARFHRLRDHQPGCPQRHHRPRAG